MTPFRLDRLLTLYFFYPLLRIIRSNKEPRIPILMYHSISNSRQEGIHPYYETTTSPQVFAEHMKFLHENGYQVINLHDVKEYLTNRINKDRKAVVITFDDGFRDFYTEAFPILQKYGFTATMFLPTQFINNERSKFKDKECLSWNEVRELHRQGLTFGSHTVTHPQLNSLKPNDIEYELRHSKETIEDKIGEPIESFSYPFAFPEVDRKLKTFLRDVLHKRSYKYGVTTRIGTTTKNDDAFFLKRIPVNSLDDMVLLKAKIEGGYDWFFRFQFIYKSLKNYRKKGQTL